MNSTEDISWFSVQFNNSTSLESEGRQALFGSCLKRDSYGNCCPPVVNALAWLALLAGIALATFFLRKDIWTRLQRYKYVLQECNHSKHRWKEFWAIIFNKWGCCAGCHQVVRNEKEDDWKKISGGSRTLLVAFVTWSWPLEMLILGWKVSLKPQWTSKKKKRK